MQIWYIFAIERMKYKLSAWLVFVLLAAIAHSQPNGKFTEYMGKVTVAELQIKDCPYDKNADAIALYDLGDVYYNNESKNDQFVRFAITSAYYQRIKVLTPKGAERAFFELRYSDVGDESISNIKVVAYNLLADGTIKASYLDTSSIKVRRLKGVQVSLTFTVPDVKVGTVFEVRYEKKQYLGYTLPGWQFNLTMPCYVSKLRIGFLDAFDYYVGQHIKHDSFEVKQDRFRSPTPSWFLSTLGDGTLQGTMVTFTAYNLPRVDNEPYMNNRFNYIGHLDFQLRGVLPPYSSITPVIKNWQHFNDYMLNYNKIASSITTGGIPAKLLQPLINNLTDTLDKAKAVFEFVRGSMECNNFVGVYFTTGINNAWADRKGNGGQINLLLVNALRKAGVNASPMLCGMRAYRNPDKSYPLFSQFITLVALVDYGGKKYILDATEKFLPFGQPPYELLDNMGYVLQDANTTYWYAITNAGSNTDVVTVKALFTPDRVLSGTITRNVSNYTAAYYNQYSTAGDRQGAAKYYYNTQAPAIEIENYNDVIDTVKARYTQTVDFSTKPFTDTSGDIYISLQSVFTNQLYHFVDSSRISAVDFGYTQKIFTTLQLQLPEGYSIDSLPAPVAIATDDKSITCLFNAELMGNTLQMQVKVDYNESIYEPAQYKAFYQFHQHLYSILNNPVLLHKKQ